MSKTSTTRSSADLGPADFGMSPEDWAALRALTDAENISAAESDPGNPPLKTE